jgi:hypothetical protein
MGKRFAMLLSVGCGWRGAGAQTVMALVKR